jgi:hypothetical protein
MAEAFTRPLTPEEIKNGWTAETLAVYLRDSEMRARKRILGDPDAKPMPKIINGSAFDPHNW